MVMMAMLGLSRTAAGVGPLGGAINGEMGLYSGDRRHQQRLASLDYSDQIDSDPVKLPPLVLKQQLVS